MGIINSLIKKQLGSSLIYLLKDVAKFVEQWLEFKPEKDKPAAPQRAASKPNSNPATKKYDYKDNADVFNTRR